MIYDFQISRTDRNSQKRHNSFLILFTGLSGAGKSTLANAVEKELFDQAINTYVLDGDNVRTRISKDLTFSAADRTENIRRVGEISHLFIDAGVVVLACFISPYEKDRQEVAATVGIENFVEVFVNAPLEICEERDPKGLYKKARKGVIPSFTGISAPYETPKHPTIEIRTNELTIQDSVKEVMREIQAKLKLQD